MSEKKQTDDLPPRTQIALSRPDVSAREAVGIISDHAGNRIRQTKAFSVAIAGAADVNGRLSIATVEVKKAAFWSSHGTGIGLMTENG